MGGLGRTPLSQYQQRSQKNTEKSQPNRLCVICDADSDGDYICCDFCNLWYHRDCLEMTKKQFTSASKKTWFCSSQCQIKSKKSSAVDKEEEFEFDVENPTNKDLMKAILKVSDSQKFLNSQFEANKQDIHNLKKDNQAIRHDVDNIIEENKVLKSTVDKLEYANIKSNLEIRGVPFNEHENLADILKSILIKIQANHIELQPANIYRTQHSINPNIPHGRIKHPNIIAVVTEKTRDEILALKKTFGKLTTQDIQDAIPKQSSSKTEIYLSEQLTSTTKHLLWLARTTLDAVGYKWAWAKHGKVYMRKTDTSKPVPISSPRDISRIKGDDEPPSM